jgi:opacity protein-like surface antigen
MKNFLWIIVIIILIMWGASSRRQSQETDEILQNHPNYTGYKKSKDCSDLEPENPYSLGSGHYAGFNWGEQGNSCGGNSNSFIEGCYEYEAQDEAYSACVSYS